ncbi:pyridoxamine 5'-phosphate oxidase family protein [Phytoactinopolyspora limicola]|uniref:pyridoxamine 5'-phosphate oxidase family protein n=1 Tax=Phytoactinopolyspora limicola TaxID=2715536 RepID=UPI001A9C4C98|nr:pyridoxamine 5'-phosphate oxidase family protein [Phytoactinopolyspora limicola]
MEPARSPQERKRDTLGRLESDVDAWVATADSRGDAHMVPLSFRWDGVGMIVSIPPNSVTARNFDQGGRVRVGLGELRDVVVIDAAAESIDDDASKDAFAQLGWDPRDETKDYAYFRLVPDRIQAWRESNELSGRTLMRDGVWLL